MTYLITGDMSLIQKEVDDIINKNKTSSVIKYNLEDNDIGLAINELNTIDLFNNRKIVIVNSLEKIDKGEELISYLEKSNDDNILILTSTQKLDERKKVIKVIKQKSKVIDTSNISLDSFIKDRFDDYTIDNNAIRLLKEYTLNNYFKVQQEIDKLKMLKLDTKIITIQDVKDVVKKSFDKNIFDFLKAINEKDKEKMLEIYYELIDNREDEMKIIGTLANNFRLLYQIKILKDMKSEQECISILKIHPYRFKILREETYKYSCQKLLFYLQELSELDIKIKSGVIDKKMGMELFLTKI